MISCMMSQGNSIRAWWDLKWFHQRICKKEQTKTGDWSAVFQMHFESFIEKNQTFSFVRLTSSWTYLLFFLPHYLLVFYGPNRVNNINRIICRCSLVADATFPESPAADNSCPPDLEDNESVITCTTEICDDDMFTDDDSQAETGEVEQLREPMRSEGH